MLAPLVGGKANGVGTAIARDAQHRPRSYAVWGSPTTEKPFWASGNYTFDGAGNIIAIGAQRFGYDGASRLKHAEILPQAQSPSTPTFDVVNWTYDLYGNMTDQALAGSSAANPPPLTFHHTYGAAGPANHNQVTMSGFAYDGNGNTRRFTGQLGPADAVGALWDSQNRLTAFVQGDPWAGSAPGESYAYDADGYRFLRLSLDNGGKALLSLRDGEGRTLSEFVDEPSGGLKLARDFVYGVGQLLVERQVTSAPPQVLLGSPLVSGGSYHLTVSDGSAAPSYELDIRTASGFQNRLTGLQRDAAQQVHVPESALSPGETNVLRLRAEGEPGTGYSVPVSLLYDPSVTPSSPNQIRALGVSRSGTDLVLRWALLTENGKQTKVSFRRADTGATYVLTPQALASSIKSYTLSSQALASPCGDFLLSQVLQANETGPTPPLRNPSSQSGTQGTEIDPCDDPPPDPAPGPRFTNAYHHRDHLGTLRNVTGDGGYLAAAYDWYPYGTRMRTGLADSASDSRRVFTGHERDTATGLDYMMARYYGSSLGRFMAADPSPESIVPTDSQTWNRYAYVTNNPLVFIDPTGETLTVSGSEADKKQFQQTANSGMYGQEATIDQNGNVTLASNGMQGPPTAEQAALADTLSTVINHSSDTAISVSSGSSTLVGSYNKSDIDMADVQAFGNGPGATATGKLAHEVTEQYHKQVLGQGYGTETSGAHGAGIAAENRVTGWTRGQEGPFTGRRNADGTLTGTFTVPYTKDRGRVNVTYNVDHNNVKVTRN